MVSHGCAAGCTAIIYLWRTDGVGAGGTAGCTAGIHHGIIDRMWPGSSDEACPGCTTGLTARARPGCTAGSTAEVSPDGTAGV